MNNEAEMREVFKELNFKNQADLLVCARQTYITQKEITNEEVFMYDRNTNRCIGIRNRGSVRPNSPDSQS